MTAESNNAFQTFISDLKLKSQTQNKKWFILGNESSDLDSVVSSIVYAYIKHYKVQETFDVIPVLLIRKKHIHLKKDVLLWLQKFNIDALSQLVFLEDVMENLADNVCVVSLIDHHKPQLDSIESRVKEVIDHRPELFQYPSDQLDLKLIQPVGSCCTLVAEILPKMDSVQCRNLLLEMLYGPILLDTDCLASNSNKTTNRDEEVIATIEEQLSLNTEDRSRVYASLLEAKSDVSGYSLLEMVTRDLKFVNVNWRGEDLKIAVPTIISMDPETLLKDEDLESRLGEVLAEIKADVFIGLTRAHQGGYVIYSRHEKLNRKMNQHMISTLTKLSTVSNSGPKLMGLVHTTQGPNRKEFIPLLEQFFSTDNDSNDKVVIQINNCNSTVDPMTPFVTEGGDTIPESEGAPYTLSTPRRSCSSSPVERDEAESALPSLNNKRTLDLVDRKRQKHCADLHDEMDLLHGPGAVFDDKIESDDDNGNEQEDMEPFTPENSDEDSDSDSKRDTVGPLPSLNNSSTVDKIRHKRQRLSQELRNHFAGQSDSDEEMVATVPLDEMGKARLPMSQQHQHNQHQHMSGNENPFTPNNSICEDVSCKSVEFLDHDQWNHNPDLLTDKVEQKRQKLETENYEQAAMSLVQAAISRSVRLVSGEKEQTEDERSGSEQAQLLASLEIGDMEAVAALLTEAMLQDCVKQLEQQQQDASDKQWNTSQPKEQQQLFAGSCNNNALSSADVVMVAEEMEMHEEDEEEELEEDRIDLEVDYNRCPIETVLSSRESQGAPVLTSCIQLSSPDTIENTCLSLYRRLSKNEVDFTEDERVLMATAGADPFAALDIVEDPDIATIQSACVHTIEEPNTVDDQWQQAQQPPEAKNNNPEHDLKHDTTNSESRCSTDLSFNNTDNLVTPELSLTDDGALVGEPHSALDADTKANSNLAAGDVPSQPQLNDVQKPQTTDRRISAAVSGQETGVWDCSVVVRDCGHYADKDNDGIQTQLIAVYGCYLPGRTDPNYEDMMAYLFQHITTTLETIKCDNYTIIYFHCYGNSKRAPAISWMRQCYQAINYKLKKNLKHLYIVHPTIWFRGMVLISRLFINTKFYQKIQYIKQLENLNDHIPTSSIPVPCEVLGDPQE